MSRKSIEINEEKVKGIWGNLFEKRCKSRCMR